MGAAVAAAISTVSITTMNSVHGRFALTSSRTQADAVAAAHEHTNACTLLRLPDAHLPPEFLILRRRSGPRFSFVCGLPASNFKGAIQRARGQKQGTNLSLLGHSRFQSPRLEKGGRSGIWLSANDVCLPSVDALAHRIFRAWQIYIQRLSSTLRRAIRLSR